MDLDLSLMKQLLTLNETIEDLKWQRKFFIHQSSLPSSSCDLQTPTDWMASDADISESVFDEARPLTENNKACSDQIALATSSPKCSDNGLQFDFASKDPTVYLEQDSFDSGIHEHTSNDSIP